MSFLTGSGKNSWQPVMADDDTTNRSYWFNGRMLVCTIWVSMSFVYTLFLISKNEGPRKSKDGTKETEKDPPGLVYKDEVWRPSLKSIHPRWLLAYRLLTCIILALMLYLNYYQYGYEIVFFYTQWTFFSLILFFGFGTVMSIYGCFYYQNKVCDARLENEGFDLEHGAHGASTNSNTSNVSDTAKSLGPNEECPRQIAGFWGYLFQISFQMNAGAVFMTDFVFWFILFPLQNAYDRDYHMDNDVRLEITYSLHFLVLVSFTSNSFIILLHSFNAMVLLGEIALNSLRYPWFRIAYFFLWTVSFVLFQWAVHVFENRGWPYPFLDMSNALAPIWYISVSLIHLPAYGIFLLIMKLKTWLLWKCFPQTCQCPR